MKASKILFVENDPDHAEFIKELIEKECKKKVILKKDGKEAMDYFWRNGKFGQDTPEEVDEKVRCSQIDLVVLDLNLPKVKGMDVLKFLKRNPMYMSIPVVIISTSADDKTIEEAYENGAAEFITKSVSFHVFMEKITLLSDYLSSANVTTGENLYDNMNGIGVCTTVLT